MKLLAIETATEACSVALHIDGQTRDRFSLAPRGHADLLLPWVGELLAEGGTTIRQLDALVFGRGPGSFTSLRIGIGAAQGLAWGADIPVVPVSSLQTTAQVAASDGAQRVLVALDARMSEVYFGAFERDEKGLMHAAGPESVGPPARVRIPDARAWSGIGNGFERYPELAALSSGLEAVHADTWPRAGAMIALAQEWLRHNRALPADRAQPVYLRDKVAEKPAATPNPA
jgi:tRNA threonylcarbamoyladenosine biosynthesis protein TsaB